MKLAPLGRLGHRISSSAASACSAVFNAFKTEASVTGCESTASYSSTPRMVEIKGFEDTLKAMRARVQEQGDVVRNLKSNHAPEAEIKSALAELKARRKLLEEKELELLPPVPNFDRTKLEDLLKQKFFYDQAFAIYGGVQGLYDFGPMGCAMKANLLAAWRQHFILEDHLLEVDCSMLTPHPVLQASGHVDRFTDWMVKDLTTGECYRADHLVKANLEAKEKHKKTSAEEKEEIRKILTQLDNYGGDELNDVIRRYDMKAPGSDHDLSEPQKFNLMFTTSIGPTGQCQGYLRPETAQGIFVNFQRLLQFNQGRIPFGAAQIGTAFRNEISPRSGLIRVREFAMAEIEYFVDPRDKSHPKFDQVKDVQLTLYSACDQMDGNSAQKMTVGEAVNQNIIANETLGYFIARIQLFLILVGIDPDRLRFRQHLSNEMAHYACDCWDAECFTSYGWVECVGCADRSCYDLSQHAKATGTRLVAEKRLSEPRTIQVCECVPDKASLGKAFRGESKLITERLSSLSLDEALKIKQDLADSGKTELTVSDKSFTLDSSMIRVNEHEAKTHVEEIIPNVIEPSFGIGRVLYAVFEHSFRVREGDEQRTYLSVKPILAPYKCSVLPLSTNPEFSPFIKQLSLSLTRLGVSHRIDESSGSIGRRYARTDQIAIPYGITIDFDTVNKSPPSATLRERDSMKQIRVPLDSLASLVSDLSNGILDWSEVQAIYPAFEQQETGQRDVAATPEPPTTGVESSPEHQPMADTSQEHPDDWQSVSEEPDGTQKKPDREVEEADRESWSSATEEPDIQPKADGVSTESLKVSQEEQPQEQESVHGAPQHTELDEQADTSVIAEKPGENEPAHEITEPVVSTPPAAHTKAEKHENQSKHSSFPRFLDFSEWGKAIRRCYQEEENREKAMSAKEVAASHSFSPETEEPRSSLSGYEADQEDNVMSKSSITSPLSHTEKTDVKEGILEQSADQSTAPEPGETAFISSELVDKKEQGCKEDLPGRDVESDSAPPADTAIPNHGLFAGHGWPGMKSEPEKNPLSDLISNVPVCETVTEPSQAETNLDTSGGDWASVMAGIYDRTDEPSTWSHGLDQPVCFPHSPVTPDLTIPPGEEVHPETTHAPKDNLQDLIGHHTNKPGEVSDDELKGYHGLFAGHGWPSKKHGSSKGREESPKLGTEHPGHEAGESELPSSQMEISKSPVPPEPQATTVEDQVDLTLSGFQSTEPKTEESALSGHMGGGHGSLGRKHRSGKKKGRSPKVSGSDYETHRGSPFPGVALVGMEEQEVNVPSELQQASEVPLPPEDMSSAKEVEETHVPQKSDEEREIPIETFEKPEEEKEIPIEVEPSEAKEVTDTVVPSLWEADVQKEETELGDHLGGGHGSLGRKHRSGKKKGRSPKVSGSDYETHRESPMPESEKPKSAEAEADFPVEFEPSSHSPLVPAAELGETCEKPEEEKEIPIEVEPSEAKEVTDMVVPSLWEADVQKEETELGDHLGGGHGSLGRKHRSGKKKGRSPKVSGSDYETHRGSPFPGVALVGMEEQEVNVPSELQQASEVPLPPEDMSSAKEVEETHVPQKSDEEREIPIETFEKPEEEKEIPIEVEPSEAKEVTDTVVPSLWEADVQKEETELGDHLGGGHGSLGRKHRSGKKKGRSPKVSGSDYETHRESPMPESEKPKSAEAEADFPVEFELSSRSPLVPDAFKSTLADEGKISPWEKESHTPDTPSDEHVTVGDEKHPVPTMPTQEPAVNDWNSGFGAFYGGSPGGHVWKTDEKELAELKQQMERSEDNLNVPSSVTETERVPVNETGSQAVTGIMNDVQPETEESEEHMRKLESLSDSIKPQVELDLSIAPGGEGQSVENLTERSTVLEEVSKPADQQTAISTSSPTPVAAETAPAVTVISKVAEDKKETEDITIHPLGDQPVDLNAPKVTVSGAGVNDDKTGTLKSKKKKSRRKPKKKT